MNKILLLSTLILGFCSCSKLKEVLPNKNKASFKINGEEVNNPFISYSPYSSSGCTASGTVSIEGLDNKGRVVELIIFNLLKMEGSNVTKNM